MVGESSHLEGSSLSKSTASREGHFGSMPRGFTFSKEVNNGYDVNVVGEGITRLLNRFTEADSPEALIFMDRSARPLARIFRQVWRELELPADHYPKIRFLNFGRGDHAYREKIARFVALKDSQLLEQEGKNPQDPEVQNEALVSRFIRGLQGIQRILVVDDIVVQGSTKRNTMDALRQSLPDIPGKNIEMMALLTSPIFQDVTPNQLGVIERMQETPTGGIYAEPFAVPTQTVNDPDHKKAGYIYNPPLDNYAPLVYHPSEKRAYREWLDTLAHQVAQKIKTSATS